MKLMIEEPGKEKRVDLAMSCPCLLRLPAKNDLALWRGIPPVLLLENLLHIHRLFYDVALSD